jgi:16S rRNA (guanine966-N2)-methyltransferase
MRITGGSFRSRVLRSPPGRVTRPTSDRVREALFSILSSKGAIEDALVLDLYAGSGALALEALSRGAARAVMVESSRPAASAIRSNVAALGVQERVLLLESTVGRAVGRLAGDGPFGLVFADPPWATVDTGEAKLSLSAVVCAGAIRQDAWVAVEHASRSASPEIEGLVLCEKRRYGDTALALYKTGILSRASAESPTRRAPSSQ